MAALTASLIALSAAGGISQAAGQQRQAKAVRKAGEYEGRALDYNAAVEDLQATDALARGREAESRLGSDVKRLGGSQRAALAAQGIDIDSGSAADVQAETKALGAFDQLTIRNNARREAFGHTVAATDARLRAKAARKGAANQASALRTASYGTLLTTGASVADTYSRRPRAPGSR